MLTLLAIILLLSALVYGVYFLWKRRVERELREGAKSEYQRLTKSGAKLVQELGEDEFIQLYHKANVPRYPAYMVASIITFLGSVPIILILLAAGQWMMDRWLDNTVPEELINRYSYGEDGISPITRVDPEALHFILNDWAGFYYFFGFLIVWIAIFWVFMRRYHARTPAGLQAEITRYRMERAEQGAAGAGQSSKTSEANASGTLGNGKADSETDNQGQPDRQLP